MTHDELLTRIEDKFNNHTALHDAQIVNALYRVVELHEPFGDIMCCVCEGISYPCSTIQAIEKELNG